jgi:hypothetical protein
VTGIADAQRPLDDERRPRPVLLGLLAVVVLLLVVAWIRYDPMERGGAGSCPEGSREMPVGDPAEPGDDAVVCAIGNRDSTTAEFSTTAYNSGLLPVRVTDVALRDEIQGVLTVDEILMWPENNQRGDVDADLVPFEPFRLGPGDERLVWVRATLPECEQAPRDRVLLFRDLPLRASVLGLPRDSDVPFDPPVRLIVERC